MTANNLRDAMINELGEASELLPPLEKKIYLKKKKIFHICSSFFSAHKARRWRGRKISFVKILFFFFFFGKISWPVLAAVPPPTASLVLASVPRRRKTVKRTQT